MSTRQSPGEDKTNACCSCSRRFSWYDCRGADSRARRNAADPYRPSLKWYALPNCHCEGASRPWQSREGTCSPYRPSLKWYALPNCHCEGASRPWQSHAPTSEFAEVALLSTRVLRDCTPRALPRASRSGRHVGLRPPRNDKPGALHGRRRRAEICNCHRRSVSAATDTIGSCHCIDTRHESPVQRRERHAAPLQRTTGGRRSYSPSATP